MATILYIEDNDDNAYMLRGRLEMNGHAVFIAEDGERGIAQAAAIQPDIVIMDLVLPDIDGWEATREIKACQATAHIPIVVLSSNASTEDRRKSLEAGASDYDTKPVDFNRLQRKIMACLS